MTFNINIIVLLLFALTVFPGSVFAIDIFKDEDVIWRKDRNVFIKYAEQGNSDFGENDHPAELNPDEISKALASLQFSKKGSGNVDSEQVSVSVFTDEQIDLLSQNLAKGLKKAESNQDIVFALEKSQSKVFGLIKSQFFVAGRAFYKDGNLNLIIGDYDRIRDKDFEAAYDPTQVGIWSYEFDFGKRSESSIDKSHGFKEHIAKVRGIESKQTKGVRRNDWLVIDLKVASEAAVLKAKTQKHEELERKREELKEILDSEDISQPASSPAPATAPSTATRSAEERLRTLNDLKKKGLITDEEYATKRKQILEEL